MIRKVSPQDARDITEIYNYYILHTTVTFETEALSVSEMQQRIEKISSEFPYFVHESEGRVDGYCYVHQLGERAAFKGSVEISAYILHGFTGKGIGSGLFKKMTDECRSRGYRAIFSLVTADNAASQTLSRKFGFEQVGRLKNAGLKFGKLLDLLYFELLLHE